MTVTKQFCDHCGNEVRNGNALRPVELHPFHWGATTVRHVCAKCLKDIEEYIGTAKHTKPPLGVTPRWLADEMRVREIAEAGWEPVTLARSSNRNVFVERFGRRYLTLCNDTATPQKARVTLDFPVRQQAVERISGAPVAVSADGVFTIGLQPQTTALIDFEPGA